MREARATEAWENELEPLPVGESGGAEHTHSEPWAPPRSAPGEPLPGSGHGAVQSDAVAPLLLPGFTWISAVARLHLHRPG